MFTIGGESSRIINIIMWYWCDNDLNSKYKLFKFTEWGGTHFTPSLNLIKNPCYTSLSENNTNNSTWIKKSCYILESLRGYKDCDIRNFWTAINLCMVKYYGGVYATDEDKNISLSCIWNIYEFM